MIGRAPLAARVAVAGLAAMAIAYPLRVAMVSPQVSLAVRVMVARGAACVFRRPQRTPLS